MNLLNDIKDFFFPRHCVCCGRKLLTGEHTVCLACQVELPRTHISGQPGSALEKSFWGCFPIERAASLFYYHKGGIEAQILYAMKYHGHRLACLQMGKEMAYEFRSHGFFDGVDYIVPIPLHKERLRQRGYNQSELLAEGISSVIQIPLCTDAVQRVHNNATQTHKSGYERWNNVSGLFVSTPLAVRLKDKHILVVDDVLTTGATIVSFCDALSQIEGLRISVATLAWARNWI